MRLSGKILFVALTVALPVLLRANPGDVDNSHDYPGFTRPPGFIITDYSEDNPAVFDFSIARPQPIDSGHLDTIHVTGHRYVIRYAPASGNPPLSLIETQRYCEGLAAAAGFTIEKTGATGDVNETYLLRKPGYAVWVCLEPGATAYVLTVIKSVEAPPSPLVSASPIPPATPLPPVSPASPTPTGSEDPLYTALIKDGRVELPVAFLPAKPDIDTGAQPVIDRVVAIMKRHSDLLLTIEGHTDNTGDPDYNKTLSLQRARAVRALIMAGGVPRIRLFVSGLGGSDPIADDNTAEGRELNRRIELILRKP